MAEDSPFFDERPPKAPENRQEPPAPVEPPEVPSPVTEDAPNAVELLVASANQPGENILPEVDEPEEAEVVAQTREVKLVDGYPVDEVAVSIAVAIPEDVDVDEYGRIVLGPDPVELPASIAELVAEASYAELVLEESE